MSALKYTATLTADRPESSSGAPVLVITRNDGTATSYGPLDSIPELNIHAFKYVLRERRQFNANTVRKFFAPIDPAELVEAL